MRKMLCGALPLAVLLAGCGGDSRTAIAPQVPVVVAPPPVVAPTPLPPAINDSFVQLAPVPSLDTAAYGTRVFQGLPGLARTGKRIWVTWFGDPRLPGGETTGTYLILRYSDDGGTSWSREFYLVPANPSTDRLADPHLWAAPDGKLWVMYFQSGNSQSHDGQLGAWVTVIPNPLEELPQFEPGVFLADGVPMRPFLYNGDWLIPIDYPGVRPRYPDRVGMHVFRMDLPNKRVTRVTTLPRVAGADFNEPAMVQLRNGSLFAHTRSTQGLTEHRSSAAALTWPAPVKFTAYPNVPSRNVLARSPSGRLVMVFNQRMDGTNRADMTIAFSDDDGQTWPYAHVFDNRAGVSYPAIEFAENGDVLVAYDLLRWRGKIYLAQIDEQSVVSGAPKVSIKLVHEIAR